ncbi:hypothetical protein YYC_01308 [Plasmodium yoelii 17X]|nr:conserved Plasmodium protein, unknown function [Plasmodium yoelii]ETB61406.1 hypothetical protein YYC_01308 [Plasmodium yoelii 17X]CDU20518.1 conserved Plasmodium protein, unknown function [Plasmodium yoelii]VTZ81479.1 conserved Plasmodium protein, unknown function [Plasmodium yoelii]|eukprot:XP_022812860.1 conserved Plasmodium protein, unknown function [Plasmodium yoelii]
MNNYIFLLFFLFYTVCAQIPYEVQNIYKPQNPQSVNAMPGDKASADYEFKDIQNTTEKEYGENSLKKLSERYYKDIDGNNKSIFEELDQIIDIVGDKSLYFTMFQ